MKKNGEKIVMLTAYDCPTASIISDCGVDAVLVGDSLGMTVLGFENTTPVNMEHMVHHTAAVVRGGGGQLIIADMPFLSYHCGIPDAVLNAGRLIAKGGASAVKLEGGREILHEIEAILRAGIPVMGHIGLTPQSVNKLGGYKYQGKTEEDAEKLLKDAKALEKTGCFAIVLECVPKALARKISSELTIPTIGIGAGVDCDGQVLVFHDMVGLNTGHVPSFVKKYADVAEVIKNAVCEYSKDVKNKVFPNEDSTVM